MLYATAVSHSLVIQSLFFPLLWSSVRSGKHQETVKKTASRLTFADYALRRRTPRSYFRGQIGLDSICIKLNMPDVKAQLVLEAWDWGLRPLRWSLIICGPWKYLYRYKTLTKVNFRHHWIRVIYLWSACRNTEQFKHIMCLFICMFCVLTMERITSLGENQRTSSDGRWLSHHDAGVSAESFKTLERRQPTNN